MGGNDNVVVKARKSDTFCPFHLFFLFFFKFLKQIIHIVFLIEGRLSDHDHRISILVVYNFVVSSLFHALAKYSRVLLDEKYICLEKIKTSFEFSKFLLLIEEAQLEKGINFRNKLTAFMFDGLVKIKRFETPDK